MNQVGKGGRAFDRTLFSLFPQTATRAAGTGVPSSADAFSKGAAGVARMGARRIPVLAGGIQALSGDPIGGVGTAAGGVLGGMVGSLAGPLGTIAGSYLGSQLGQSATRGLAGIDMSDPYSGPDLNLFGIALSPYAKTKKRKERAREERTKDMEAMEPFIQKQMGREMAAQQQVITGNLMQTALANARFGR